MTSRRIRTGGLVAVVVLALGIALAVHADRAPTVVPGHGTGPRAAHLLGGDGLLGRELVRAPARLRPPHLDAVLPAAAALVALALCIVLLPPDPRPVTVARRQVQPARAPPLLRPAAARPVARRSTTPSSRGAFLVPPRRPHLRGPRALAGRRRVAPLAGRP